MTSQNDYQLTQLIAPSFYSVHHCIKRKEYASYWLKGGRGSTKSSFASIQIVLGIMADSEANALILRKVADTIQKSVFQSVLWAIDKLGVSDNFTYTKSPAKITYIPTGQEIQFSGCDDPRKLKSIKVRKGKFKFLWFEEAEEFSGMDEIRNIEQSVMRGEEDENTDYDDLYAGEQDFVEFITYNPPNDPNAWVNKEAAQNDDPLRLVHSSTYLDVPKHWLGKIALRKAELLKERDREAYNHEYLGQAVGRAEQIVFHGKWLEKEFETPPARDCYQGRYFYGADWGFANDPTVLVRCFIQNNCLYFDYEARGVGVEIDDTPALFDRVPESRKWKIYADCARPETISYMSRNRFNCHAAPKWQGSVEEGVQYLKSFDIIYIHPRCKGLIEEFEKYSYKVDKHTQEILPALVDDWNHGIDAARYALADYIKANVSILDVL